MLKAMRREAEMARFARLDAPSMLHYIIIIRRIEHRNIFGENQDRDNQRTKKPLPYHAMLLSRHSRLDSDPAFW
jgi:hypothetical protein